MSICWLQTTLRIDSLSPALKLCTNRCKKEWLFQEITEEADVNIAKQCVSCAMENNRCIKVICEDTDVFVLLTAYILKYSIESLVLMEAFASNRSMVEINKAKRNTEIVPLLIVAHALSGCRIVPKMFGIGKKKIVSVLQQGFQLQKLGDIQSEKTLINEECSKFVAACYGFKDKSNLTNKDKEEINHDTKATKVRVPPTYD